MKKIILNHHYNNLRLELLQQYGNKCNKCGIKNIRVLEFNHKIPVFITKEKRFVGKEYYIDIKNNPDKYEILCKNCNFLHLIYWRDKLNKDVIDKANQLRKKGLTYYQISKKVKRSESWVKQRVKPVLFTSIEKFNNDTKKCSICIKYFGEELNLLRERFHSSRHRAKQCINIHRYGKFDGKL